MIDSQLSELFADVFLSPQQFDCVPSPESYLTDIGVDFDLHGQFIAISKLLETNRAAARELDKKYRSVRDDPTIVGDHIGDYLNDLAHETIFQDAAHSMAAVGMLAPLLETIFTECLKEIGSTFPSVQPVRHLRCLKMKKNHWDCHYVIEKNRCEKDLVGGIMQLTDAIGLRPHLPGDIGTVLGALFAYRNKMFHYGVEWPIDQRKSFQCRIEKEWPTAWFQFSGTNDEPWIYYMSDEFIDHCVETTDHVIKAIGEFVRDRPWTLSNAT